MSIFFYRIDTQTSTIQVNLAERRSQLTQLRSVLNDDCVNPVGLQEIVAADRRQNQSTTDVGIQTLSCPSVQSKKTNTSLNETHQPSYGEHGVV